MCSSDTGLPSSDKEYYTFFVSRLRCRLGLVLPRIHGCSGFLCWSPKDVRAPRDVGWEVKDIGEHIMLGSTSDPWWSCSCLRSVTMFWGGVAYPWLGDLVE
ncbi:hypothetical protein GW17_00006256 [Ensete ventricosum]|nr:hypothetical protein GW17_00006256 [Ensete ventricosum]RZR76463.1 hypothetical protein BHM03_00001246 [Ensete ventricosum]